MSTLYSFYGNLPIIRNSRVRNKILLAFILVLIVFLVGLVIIYNSSSQLASANENIVNNVSTIRTKSYEISIGFEQQQSLFKSYSNGETLNIQTKFQDNQAVLDSNISQLDDLVAGTSIKPIVDSIKANSSIFSNVVLNGLMNFPNAKQVSTIEFDSATMLSDLTNMYSSIVDYDITNTSTDFSYYQGYKTDFNSVLSQYSTTVSSMQSINTKIYNEFNQFYTNLNNDYNNLINNVFDPAINSPVNGTQWITINRQSINAVSSDISKISSNIPVFDNLASSLFTKANSDLQPILNDLTALRSESDQQLATARQNSIDASNLVNITIVSVLIGGIVLSLFIALSISYTISKPLENLTKKSKVIASGDLTLTLDEETTNNHD